MGVETPYERAVQEMIKKVARETRKEGGETDLFPFDSPRRGQAEFLSNARSVLEGGGHLIAHAPTGLGKTAVALTAAVEAALALDKVVFFLTSRQSQHRLAVETLRLMRKKRGIVAVDVISKKDMCLQPNRPDGPSFFLYCAEMIKRGRCSFYKNHDPDGYVKPVQHPFHVEELVRIGEKHGMCPHRMAMDLLAEADVVVCDYNYLFSDMLEQTLSRLARPIEDIIVVVDEAHNLPGRIQSQQTFSLTPYLVDEAYRECRGQLRIQRHLEALRDFFEKMNRKAGYNPMKVVEEDSPDERVQSVEAAGKKESGEFLVEKEELVDFVERSLRGTLSYLTYDEFSMLLRSVGEKAAAAGATSASVEIADFLDKWKEDRESAVRFFRGGPYPRLTYRVMDPSLLAREVFAGVHASLLMSGTLYPMEMYRDLLGMENRRTVLKEYPSPFPRENRPVIVDASVSTVYRERGEEMYRTIASHLSEVLAGVPKNAAIFFPSYQVLEEVNRYLEVYPKRRWVEQQGMKKEEKDLLLDRLLEEKKSGEGMVVLGVMGASLAEGVDYRDNALDLVAIVGFPLAPPTLETALMVDFYKDRFGEEKGELYGYVQPAMNRVLQAAGRAIRSAEDRAVILLMDNRFLWKRYRRCFPEDFQPKRVKDVAAFVRDFFVMHP